MSSVDDELGKAAVALEAGDAAEALTHVLSAWRATKRHEIGDLAFAVARVAEPAEPPLDAGKETSQGRRWLARAEERRPASLGLLLADVVDHGPHVAATRLAALRGWPTDPRLARALAGWLERPPFRGPGRRRFFPTLIELLREQEDPTVRLLLDGILAPDQKSVAILRVGQQQVPLLVAARDALAKVQRTAILDSSTKTAIARIEALLAADRAAPRKKQTSELLADVYAAPEDDAPRLVYADALTEAGDPRGELIVLQCERARAGGVKASRREAQLLKGYERAWLGAIEPAVLKSGVRFERGFVAACRYKAAGQADTVEAPEWSTVIELDVEPQSSFMGGSARLLLQPHLRALRRVLGMQVDDLKKIAAHHDPFAWTAISIHFWRGHGNALLAILEPGIATLPALTELGLAHDLIDVSLVAPLLGSRVGRLLGRFEAIVAGHDLGTAVAALASAPACLREAVFRVGLCSLSLAREGDAFCRAVATLDSAQSHHVANLATSLSTLAPGSLASLAVVAGVGEIEGGYIRHGRHARGSLASLKDAAKRLDVTLDVG